MTEKESLKNNIAQDLRRRNDNLDKINSLLSLKADKNYVDNKISGIVIPEGGLTPEKIKLIKVNKASDADTVNGFTVSKSVPVNAVFSDTIVDVSQKVDKVSGKSLSTNDYTNTDKAEVNKIKDKVDKNYVDDKVKTNVPYNAKFTDTIFNPRSMSKYDIETAVGFDLKKIVIKQGDNFSPSELKEGEIGFLY